MRELVKKLRKYQIQIRKAIGPFVDHNTVADNGGSGIYDASNPRSHTVQHCTIAGNASQIASTSNSWQRAMCSTMCLGAVRYRMCSLVCARKQRSPKPA